MAVSLPATGTRVAKPLNPAEMICPSSATGPVTKYLIIRNPLPIEIAVKLRPCSEAMQFMTLDASSLRLKGNSDKANSIARVKVLIQPERVINGAQLRIFVRSWNPSTEVGNWMEATGNGTNRQLAFSLNIRKANAFSARDTVLDLPGSALIFTQDDAGTETARAIEEDCLTARNCDSIADYMAEIRQRKITKKAEKTGAQCNWGIMDMASSVAESLKSWYESAPALPAPPAAKKAVAKKTVTKTTTKKTGPDASGRSKKTRSTFVETNNGRCKKRTVHLETEYVNQETKETPVAAV